MVKRLTEGPHAPSHGSNNEPPDIPMLHSGGDRGYTLQAVLEYFIKGGASPFGTMKRCHHNPFSYGIKLKDTDKRTDIEMQGGMNLFIKKTSMNNTQIYIAAYCDPTNSVCVGISTEIDSFHWDFVARNPRDAIWYFDPGNIEELDDNEKQKLKVKRSMHGFLDVNGKRMITNKLFGGLLTKLLTEVRI